MRQNGMITLCLIARERLAEGAAGNRAASDILHLW